MSQIRAILFRLRAAIVLVAIAAVFGGVALSVPSARAAVAAGVSAPCDHLASAVAMAPGAPAKQTGHASHCPECCLFGGVGDVALTPRTSLFAKPPTATQAIGFYATSGARPPEFLLSGAANGARAPPAAI